MNFGLRNVMFFRGFVRFWHSSRCTDLKLLLFRQLEPAVEKKNEYIFNDSSFVTSAKKKHLCFFSVERAQFVYLRYSNFTLTHDNISTFLVSYSDKRQTQELNSFSVRVKICEFAFIPSFITNKKTYISALQYTIDMHRFIFQRFSTDIWNQK